MRDMASIIPVSYTHLATYDAILDYIRFLKQTADISVIAIDTSTYKAVSYTPIDVYKRQG